MKFDEILVKLGEFGTYQKRLYFLLCIPSISAGFHMVISVFLMGTPDHRCAIPGYQNDTFAIQSDYHRALVTRLVPPSSDETLDYDQCNLYDRTFDGNDNATTKVECSSWVYDKTVFISTFTSEYILEWVETYLKICVWGKTRSQGYDTYDDNTRDFDKYDQNLVCGDKLKTSHAQMIFFAGVLVGAIGLGSLSDIIGRKKTLYISFLLLIGSTLGVAWAPNFTVFCILRFLVGCSCAGMFMTGFVIGMELVGPSKRVWAGIVIEYFFAIGLVVLGGIGYAFKDWKYIEITCAAPGAIFLLYWWLIPESPRWLISQGKLKEANKVIEKAAKVNKVDLPPNILTADDMEEPQTGRIWHLFTSRILLSRTLIIFFNWAVVSMVYYGLSLNTGNLGGDFYVNFLLSGLVEFPAYTLCLVLLDRTGRKILHAASMILGGVACILTIFTMLYASEDLQPITVTLAMLGKIGAAAAFAVIYVWSAEIYPTVVRNAGMGASSSCARIGGMVAPYIADLSKVIEGNLGRAIPLVIFGGCSVAAGILSIWLPETLNKHLPETIEDGKRFGKEDLPEEKYKPQPSFENKGYEKEMEIANTNGTYNGTKL